MKQHQRFRVFLKVLRSLRTVVWRERKHCGVLLWPVEAHPALGTWAQLTLSLLAMSLVPCLCPSACCQLCGDSYLTSICRNVQFPWCLCSPGVCAGFGDRVESGSSSWLCALCILLLSCRALPGIAIWLRSRFYHPRSPIVSVGLERLKGIRLPRQEQLRIPCTINLPHISELFLACSYFIKFGGGILLQHPGRAVGS